MHDTWVAVHRGHPGDCRVDCLKLPTPHDARRFTERTAVLTAQYSAYQPLPGEHVNGDLTLGENIADLSGLTVAMRAYRLSLGGQPAAMLDGFTGEQRFFLGWAQAWRAKARDKALRATAQRATQPQ